ncbi:Arsenical resistance operon trans-acting repressor ArsD [Clostridium sp. C105KSO13]|nr:Arsenical resistance operon trans-acting repressor ArsD [Clostridium sp. C105KSO13]
MKMVTIEFLYLDLNTCERCVATSDTLDEAVRLLVPVFQTLDYTVEVMKINVTTKELAEQYHFISSPTIRVNGVDICSELKESNCKDCGDLCGDSVDCRVFVYDGKEYEQPPVAMIVDGILGVLYGREYNAEVSYELPQNLNNYFRRRESIMKTMYIYEPAMCCETGICGVGVDPELLRISTVINNLKKNGVNVTRYNLNNFPQEFIDNREINKLINGEGGVDLLPATMIDGEIVKTKQYPTNAEIMNWLDIPEDYLSEGKSDQGGCCCEGGCC